MRKRILAVVIMTVMIISMASCSGDAAPAPSSAPVETEVSEADLVKIDHPDALSGEVGTELDPYTFEHYYNYDWWGINEWGADETSKFWSELYNVTMEQTKPDADPAGHLNLMMSSGDLPDTIQMDRGANNVRAVQNGIFIDLAPLEAKNPSFDNSVAEATRNLLKVEGALYAIPHWARSLPTGGNDAWMYNKEAYEAVGSPELKTFEDLYAFATAIKEQYPTNSQGKQIMPFSVDGGDNSWTKIPFSFYRSMGGPNYGDHWTIVLDGKIQSMLRDPIFKQAVIEANKWFREGLIPETQFSDTGEMLVEKWSDNRGGLMYYDFSQDPINRFRQIMMETYPGNSYELLKDPVYPPAAGVTKVYADQAETPGWNIIGITTAAENPQRIFDFFSYMLSERGSIEMMYGPEGDWWEGLDENGAPILHTPDSQMTTAEKDRIGSWRWQFCSLSDPVDLTKYAVNRATPEEFRDWTVTMQDEVITPLKFLTDEYVNFNLVVDPLSDLGMNKTLQWDAIRENMPRIITAPSPEEAEAYYDELLATLDGLGLAEIEELLTVKWQENVEIQGFSAYAE